MNKRIPTIDDFINEGIETEIENVPSEKFNELKKIAEEKIAAFKKNTKNNPVIDGWTIIVANKDKKRPVGHMVLDSPIKVIMKDKWRDTYYGYLWGYELPNTGLGGKSDTIKTNIVAFNLDETSYDGRNYSNFRYGLGYIKWYEIKVKHPKKIDIPDWDTVMNDYEKKNT